MITYAVLLSHVKPFFLSRWGDVLADTERMLFYANTSIQDVFNMDNSTFTYIDEEITWVANWDKMKFTTQFNIRKVQMAFWITSSWQEVPLRPTLFFQDCPSEYKFTTWNNEILWSTEYIKLKVIYIKEYNWIWMDWLIEEIQVPDRYIGAVIKFMYDWAAPINLMAWESLATDFYSHWVNRVNQLRDDDALTDFLALNSNI